MFWVKIGAKRPNYGQHRSVRWHRTVRSDTVFANRPYLHRIVRRITVRYRNYGQESWSTAYLDKPDMYMCVSLCMHICTCGCACFTRTTHQCLRRKQGKCVSASDWVCVYVYVCESVYAHMHVWMCLLHSYNSPVPQAQTGQTKVIECVRVYVCMCVSLCMHICTCGCACFTRTTHQCLRRKQGKPKWVVLHCLLVSQRDYVLPDQPLRRGSM